MLRRAPERPRRGHRLIDLVGQRRCHAAHQIDARDLGGFRLSFSQTGLGVARDPVGILAFADDDADDQPGHRQHQRQALEFGEFAGIVAGEVQQPDQAELSGGKTETGAVDAMAHGGDHDRHEQQVEQPVSMRPLAADNQPKRGADDAEIQRGFGGE
jgi:hypothetical protein